MSERVEIPLTALVGGTIDRVEHELGYAVLHVGDMTLYADDPTAYGADADAVADADATRDRMPRGSRVVLRTDLNSGRYDGRTGVVVDYATGSRVVVQLDRFTPGLDSPDGRVWLRQSEVEPIMQRAALVLVVRDEIARDAYDLPARVRQIADELAQGYNAGDGWALDVVGETDGESAPC